MIHILTIHWNSSKWIDIQLNYIKKNINQPYKVYAFLNGINDFDIQSKKFFYASNENIVSHPIKLNLLADMAQFNSENDDDYLVFIDGDAFPVAPIDDYCSEKLRVNPLIAIQRLENNGDIQPHPCFCVTTIKYWREINGDWKPGNIAWSNSKGHKVRDVGGKLLHILNKRKDSWYKMLRSNKNQHKNIVMFGIYDNIVYHHGAGFRPPRIRADKYHVKYFKFKKKLFKLLKKYLPKGFVMKYFHPLKSQIIKNQIKSEKVFDQIKSDFYFFKSF